LTTFALTPRPTIAKWCIRALSGGEAERLLCGDHCGVGDEVDVLQVRRRLGPAAGIAGLRFSARSLVQERRDDIATVAEALLEAGWPSGREIRRITGSHADDLPRTSPK
jgi:hypothetical protein